VSARTVAKVILVAAGVAAGLYLLYLVRTVVGLVLISIFVAIALGPAVDLFQRMGIKRWIAIVATYLSLLLSVVIVGLLIVPPIVSQTNHFVKNVPRYVDDLQKNKTIRKYDKRYHITAKLKKEATKLPSRLGSAVGALRDVTVGVFSALVQLVTVLTLAFFLLRDGKRMAEWAFLELGPVHGPLTRSIAERVYRNVGGYVLGNILISIIAGTGTFIVLKILGVPFATPLAVLMGFLDLIPLVGATIGGIVIGIVAALHNFPADPIIWAAYLIVYQQVENNVLQPVIYRRTVALHPLLVIVAVLIGAALLGVLGALVAIPVAGAVQIVARDWWELRREERVDLPPDAAPAAEGA